MREAFLSGGFLMWPLLVIAVAVLFLGARAAILLRGEAPDEAVESRLRALLFWGAMSVVLGLLGTTIGIVQVTQAIAVAGAVSPSLLSGGLAVSLVTFIFGLLIFLLSAILWFSLRQWRLRAASPRRDLAPG